MLLRGVLSRAALAIVLFAGPGVALAAAACPEADPDVLEKSLFGLGITPEFEGTVAGHRVRLFVDLDFRGEPNVVQGAIWWSPRAGDLPYPVSGVVGADCVVTVTEGGASDGEAEWTLRFEPPSRLAGHYRARDGKRWAVRLRAVAAPSCDGREPWRTFRSPDWPIAFDYPGSWILVTNQPPEVGATLACPQLAARSKDNWGADLIQLSSGGMGPMRPTNDGRLSRRVDDDFFTDGQAWRFGCDIDEELGGDCRETLKSTLNGMTVVQGRLRARNGVEYPHTLILAGERWVVVASVETLGGDRPPPGEIVLGDDVMSRVVRSARPAR